MGSRVGRYEIVEPLASGGMGIVFRAYDPELSRHVALKVVLQQSIDLERLANAEEYEKRLLREAQTLARLSHPNVVAAFDVGRFQGAVFVAMELIEGVSLRAWLEQEPRSRKDVLRMLIAAGRGLDAAHRAGVVHRDFKLSNVMISAEARAQVVDFGLARPISSTMPDEVGQRSGPEDHPFHGDEPAPAGELTATDVVMGTPGYIAPEQFDTTAAADARSDQFSYASAVFRALTGETAFRSDSLSVYRTALLQGERIRWPRSVPRALRRVVNRGLSMRPQDRYPSLGEMVDDLERAAGRPSRVRIGLALAATILAVAVVPTSILFRRHQSLCEMDVTSFDRAWNAARRADVERAFLASGNAQASDVFRRVAAQLDQYRNRWEHMRQESCAATHLRGEQSERVLGLRSVCLDTKLDQIGIATTLFTKADSAMVDRASAALREIAPLEECTDIAGLLGASERLPDDPQRRAVIAKLDAEFAAIRSVSTLGKWQEAQERARALRRQAEQAQYKPAQARAMALDYLLLERGGRREEAKTLFAQTFDLASEAKVNDVVAFLSTRMLLKAVDGEQMEAAKAMLPLVDAHLRLADNPPELRIRVSTYRAAILSADGEFEAAIAELEKARADCQTLGDAQRAVCLNPRRELGTLHLARKDYRQARRELEAVAEEAKQLFGPSHANVMNEYNNLADALLEAGDPDAALAALDESKRVAAALPTTKQGANIPLIEGRVWDTRGDCARALPFYQQGLDAVIAGYGAASHQAAVGHRLLGQCLAKVGRTAEALSHLEQSVDISRKAQVTAAKLGEAVFALAKVRWSIPAERPSARSLAEEALALFQKHGELSLDDAREVQRWLAARK